MSRWFRVYDDLVDDPKVQRLSGDNFKALMNLWCMASKNDGTLPSIEDISFKLRKELAKTVKLLKELIDCGLLDRDETGLHPHNWNARQYKSDVSTNRVKRFRERRKAVSRNGDETFQQPLLERSETQNETPPDTEYRVRSKRETSSLSLVRVKRADRKEREVTLPESFVLTEGRLLVGRANEWDDDRTQAEFARFCDSARAKGRKYVNWDAAWRNWVSSPYQKGEINGRPNGPEKGNSVVEAGQRLLARLGGQQPSFEGIDSRSYSPVCTISED